MIRGKLCGLRAVEESDLALLRDWRNIPSFRRNFREHRELSMENQRNWFETLASSACNFMFLIEDLKTGEPIGACGLLYTNWIIRAADFSFYIGKNESYIDSDGYALDATELLIRYGFAELNLNKIWMELYEYDTMKLDFFINRFGFTKDGRLRSNCFANGMYWDSFVISLLSNEYKEEHPQ